MSGEGVLLGAPADPVYVPAEIGVTKIGGIPQWLVGEPPSLGEAICTKCRVPMALVLSADCPITEDFDRVLFLFLCPKCGQEGRLFRQNAPARTIPQAEIIAPQKEDPRPAMSLIDEINSFEIPTKKKKKGANAKKPPSKPREIGTFPGTYIETFDEPEAFLDESVHFEIASSAGSDSGLETPDGDKDAIDPVLVEYNERISRCPSQVIRYAPGDAPLLQDESRFMIPPCPLCGKERVFELEVIPTIIYELDPESDMDFGPILLYCCPDDCIGEGGTTLEHCHICKP